MNDIVEYKYNLQLFTSHDDLAKQYGAYSQQITVPLASGKEDVYLVFSTEPIPEDVDPVEVFNRCMRNDNIFYPGLFAVKMNEGNPLLILERITKYLSYAESMCKLFDEFNVPMPKSIRCDELDALTNFHNNRNNVAFDAATRNRYAEGLESFFEEEKNRTKFQKEWTAFYRSELYRDDKPFLKNFVSFLKRNNPETELEVLLESNSCIKKVYVPEHWYKEFREIIKDNYPDVKFNVGDKQVVDKGIIVDPVTKEPVITQYGKCVTEEEYDRICEEKFSKEGFECLEGLNPSYFEGRNVVYKASDENIIASVLNNISYRWAKCSSFEELRQRGATECIDIPVSQIKNLYVGLKKKNIPFYLDNSVESNPSLETLHVVYNKTDAEDVTKLVVGLTVAKLTLAHVDIPAETRFYIDEEKVDNLIEQAQKRSKTISPLETESSALQPEIKNNDFNMSM